MTAPPGRPWWKKKRAWAAAAVWLAFAYPLSVGPVGYAIGRGWVSKPVGAVYVAPFILLVPFRDTPPLQAVEAYAQWWMKLGLRHAASD